MCFLPKATFPEESILWTGLKKFRKMGLNLLKVFTANLIPQFPVRRKHFYQFVKFALAIKFPWLKWGQFKFLMSRLFLLTSLITCKYNLPFHDILLDCFHALSADNRLTKKYHAENAEKKGCRKNRAPYISLYRESF